MNEITALLGAEGIELETLTARNTPSSTNQKNTTLPGNEISLEAASNLAESYKTDAFTPVSEILKLQDGDVVSFKKLGPSTNGINVKHFRIVKIEEIRRDTNHDYEIRCIANCFYFLGNKAYELSE